MANGSSATATIGSSDTLPSLSSDPSAQTQRLVYWKRKGERPNRRYCPNSCRSCRRGCRFSSSITNNFPGFDPHECPAVLGDARRGIRSGSVWGYWSIVRVGIGGIKADPPPAGPGFLFPKASFFTWYAAFWTPIRAASWARSASVSSR